MSYTVKELAALEKAVKLPWASLGRREVASSLAERALFQRNQVAHWLATPRVKLFLAPGADLTDASWQSLLAQSYPHWELHIPPSLRDRFSDPRVVVSDGNPPEATEWVGILRGGERLHPLALYRLVWEAEGADLVFCNEVIQEKTPRFVSKADFCAVNLLTFNSVGRFWLARAAAVPGLFPLAGGHEWEFLARAAMRGVRFKLSPFFFCVRTPSPPEHVPSDAVTALAGHLGIEIDPKLSRWGTNTALYPVYPPIDRPTRASVDSIGVIVCFRDRAKETIRCLEGLARQKVPSSIKLYLVNNESREGELGQIVTRARDLGLAFRVLDFAHPFNYAEMHNWAISQVGDVELLVLLNNDVFLEDPFTIHKMVAWASRREVGTVGIRLNYPRGQIQHAGFRALFGGTARLARVGHAQRADEFATKNHTVFGSTFAACAFRKEVFDENRGLRPSDFPNGFGDLFFNLQCLRRGYLNYYLGDVSAIHEEGASRGAGRDEYWEERTLESAFPEMLERMLSRDFGINRIPGTDASLKALVFERLRQGILRLFPWLPPLRHRLSALISPR